MDTPIPLNELDRTIAAMQKSQAAFPDFCRAVCEGSLWPLIPFEKGKAGEWIEIANGQPFPFVLLREPKGQAVPVFTSEARAEEGLRRGKVSKYAYSICHLQAMQFLEILGTTKFGAIFNKGCPTGSITIWPDLMRDLVSGAALKATEMAKAETEHNTLTLLDPADYPTEMVQRAFEGLRRHKNFRAAWVLGKPPTDRPHYQLLVLMDPREDVIFHDLNLVVHAQHSKSYETDMGLVDEQNPAYVASLFQQAKPFYVAADYPLPPGAKV
jgi:hypothetical protein